MQPSAAPRRSTSHQLGQDCPVNVGEALYIEAALAHLVFAKLGEKAREPLSAAAGQIDGDGRLPRGEAGQAHVAFAAAVVLVMILAEADDARARHLRRRLHRLAHQLDERMGNRRGAGRRRSRRYRPLTLASVSMVLFFAGMSGSLRGANCRKGPILALAPADGKTAAAVLYLALIPPPRLSTGCH